MSEEKKILYPGMFDFIKGVAMLDIIGGHSVAVLNSVGASSLYSNWPTALLLRLLNVLGDADIPLLFIIMGFGFRTMQQKQCLKKQTSQLLIPYLWTSIIVVCLLPFCRFYFHRDFYDAIRETGYVAISHALGLSQDASYFGHHLYAVGASWFLVAAYVGWLILNFLSNCFEGKKLFFAVCGLLLVVCCVRTEIVFPFSLIPALVCIFYLYLGWQFRQRGSFSRELPLWKWGVILVLIIPNLLFGSVGFSVPSWKLGVLDLISVAAQAFVYLWIALRINYRNFRIMKPIRIVGRYSLWVMCCETVETQALASFWYRVGMRLKDSPILGTFVVLLMKGLLIWGGCYLIFIIRKYIAQKKRMKRKIRGGRNVRS